MKGKLVVALILLAAVVVAASTGWNIYLGKAGPLTQDVTVEIPAGSSLNRIAELLSYAGVIESPMGFRLAAHVMGTGKSLKAGEYHFTAGIKLNEVLHQLNKGSVKQHLLTIPEGLTTKEIVVKLMENESLSGPILYQEEGTLLPETYAYTKGEKRMEIIRRMVAAMDYVLKETWQLRADDLLLKTPEELLVLASIVEKETQIDAERPVVAGVYLNRLKKGMRLQADPTVIYGASGFNGDITSAHLKEDHPYNTYTRKGLPPGPIGNPGKASLLATARPAQTDYLYFVADGKGGHKFARTHHEHQKNVKEYLKAYRRNLARQPSN